MGFGTTGVAFATAPAIIRAFFSHLRHHRSLRNSDSPESEVSYAEGIAIIRSFLEFASKHTVEEIQSFTKAKVPVPSWVIHEHVVLDEKHTTRAAEVLREEFDDLQSTEALGCASLTSSLASIKTNSPAIDGHSGSQWWTFRSEGLLVEWIEMRKTKMERELQEQRDKAAGKTPEPLRVLLYIHGGAHHFSSIETHRCGPPLVSNLTQRADSASGNRSDPTSCEEVWRKSPCTVISLSVCTPPLLLYDLTLTLEIMTDRSFPFHANCTTPFLPTSTSSTNVASPRHKLSFQVIRPVVELL